MASIAERTDTSRQARADLDWATAVTAAMIADPASTVADVCRAAGAEEAAHNAYLQHPGADAELQAEAELEAGG
jgi:hypothetical protein